MDEKRSAKILAHYAAAVVEIDVVIRQLVAVREKLYQAEADTHDSDTLLQLVETLPDTFDIARYLNEAYYEKYDAEYA